jgi:hypothetical protein
MSVVNFNDTTPVPANGTTNVKWQSDSSGNISASMPNSLIVTNTSVNYTATVNDEVIAMYGGTTLTLPAAPLTNQILEVRNFAAAAITINGNGFNVGAGSTFQLYPGANVRLLFSSQITNWVVLSIGNASGWQSGWTPAVTATGSMTVSSVAIPDATWMWVNTSVVNYRLNLTFTLGGTASGQVNITAPIAALSSGPQYPQMCWIQTPSDSAPSIQYYFRPDPTLGFTVRPPLVTNNFVLGAYALIAQGFYRI